MERCRGRWRLRRRKVQRCEGVKAVGEGRGGQREVDGDWLKPPLRRRRESGPVCDSLVGVFLSTETQNYSRTERLILQSKLDLLDVNQLHCRRRCSSTAAAAMGSNTIRGERSGVTSGGEVFSQGHWLQLTGAAAVVLRRLFSYRSHVRGGWRDTEELTGRSHTGSRNAALLSTDGSQIRSD